ncbi:MAG: hypothetical protein HOD13_14120 [Rhodospirillaceae bacterium]|jgi:hypothetical protein|nr:hypothetical protein [Rhodospirillaceae bacterium]MBT5912428.1 hypothetical protein [Rhodospirillaceae bacterium]MBT6307023.1 hypothetical protein [Rhodospirillaceae bacterium]MBT7730389.1 hypothetical protein [Rhodospirillaceae bacterium]MDC1441125.1 hypothetical protein [Rhodospirillaceae bacterium]
MNKINQKDQIYKKIMEKIASDGWQMLDFESLSKEFDFDVLTKNGGVTNKMDLLVSFSEFVDASVKQLFDDDLKDGEISVRERLLEALLIRFDVLAPYKVGIVELMKTFPNSPNFVFTGANSLRLSMEATLAAIGLESNGISRVIRVKGLSMVFLSAICTWSRDDSEDLSATTRVLDKRLKNVEELMLNFGLTNSK